MACSNDTNPLFNPSSASVHTQRAADTLHLLKCTRPAWLPIVYHTLIYLQSDTQSYADSNLSVRCLTVLSSFDGFVKTHRRV